MCAPSPACSPSRWWDEWSAMVAAEYFSWAQRDPMIVGIVPWYYGDDRSDATSGGYNVSVRQQPKALAVWTEIGRKMLEGPYNRQ